MSSPCAALNFVIAFGTISYLYDIYRSKDDEYRVCVHSPWFHFECWIHHLLFAFIVSGWYSTDPAVLSLYLFTIMMVIMNWESTGGFCSLTLSLNKECNLPKNTPFHDLFYWTGFKGGPHGDLFYKLFMISVFVIGIWKFRRFLCIQ